MLSACGGTGPAPFGDRSTRFAKAAGERLPVVLRMAEAFSSRRAPYAPMLLLQESRDFAADG